MNTLIINASPRKSGLISQMLDIIRTEAQRHGDAVETVYANGLVVKPCIGCMACRKTGECLYSKDDSQRVLQMLRNADNIIIGAPCYWGNIPGQLKLLFDRMVYGMMRDTDRLPEPLMKGKKCILISTCTTPWPFNIIMNQSHGAIRALREICHYAGFKIVRTVERGNTAKRPGLSGRDIARCRKAVASLYSRALCEK